MRPSADPSLRPAAPGPEPLAETAPADPPPAETAPADPPPAETAPADPPPAEMAPAGAATQQVARRRRVPAPHRWPRLAGRAAAGWAARPAGRLILPGLLIAGLLGVTGAAGAYLVPAAFPRPDGSPRADQPTAAAAPTEGPVMVAPEQQPLPLPTALPTGPPAGGREAAKLGGWAAPLSARLDVPQTALEAYGYAQWVVEQTQPSCRLSWTTLAAIGKVESDHGRTSGATLTPDGRAYPPIFGAPLDGQEGRKLIPDTDRGMLDNDLAYDRAIGPMQFIPSTWRSWETDADSNGLKDPHDVDDAALAAAKYLCAGGRDLTTPEGWWQAVLSYNDVQSYANAVFDTADRYGRQSRNTP